MAPFSSIFACSTVCLICMSYVAAFIADINGNYSSLDMVTYSQNHGPKAELSENDTYARRYEGYCWAVCITEQPLKVGETLHFNISETEPGWMSNMNVGVIYTNPDYIPPGDLVICDDNVTTSLPDTEVFIFKKFYSLDNIYHFHVNGNGTVYLSPNVTSNDVIFTGVNITRPFWVIFNIFGDTKAIQLLGKTPLEAKWKEPY